MKHFHSLLRTAVCGALIAALSTSALALEGTVATGGSVLRVRKSADTSAAILDMLPDGKRVEITDTSLTGWYGVRINGVNGYVSAQYVKLADAAQATQTAQPVQTVQSAAKAAVKTTEAPAAYVRITADVLNVRSGAGTDYAVAGELTEGRIVRVLGESEGWYQLALGYIDASYTESASFEEAVEAGLYVRVTADSLNIRSGAGTGYSKVGSLRRGSYVKILGLADGWYQIERGYISADYVEESDYTPAAVSSTGSSLADLALSFVGYSYVYGGASPSVGFDCSGLMQYVCAQFGYSINRTASTQLKNGVAVSWDELSAGDLVFFKKPGSSSAYPVSHVGMYIGDGKFVHASDYGVGVIVSRLSDAYYTTGFVAARRIAT